MQGIRRALTRKLGPLPAWGWALVAGGGLFYYRRKKSGLSPSMAAAAGNPQPVQSLPQPATPQDPVTLQPGESVYDPNTGALITPGNSTTDTTNSQIASLLAAILAAMKLQGNGRRHPKPKPHHNPPRPGGGGHGGKHHKTRKRSDSVTVKPGSGWTANPKGKTGTRVDTRARQRTMTGYVTSGAIRARPVATHPISHRAAHPAPGAHQPARPGQRRRHR